MTSENGKNHQENIDDRVEELEKQVDVLIRCHNLGLSKDSLNYIEDLSTMTERGRQIKLANEMPLGELCRKVLRGSYIPDVDDIILIERCENE